ncbi:hypothetical protein ACX1N5_04130 [Acinetobacter sp. ANC 4636]
MTLDYTLPLQVKSADPSVMLNNASQFAQYFTNMKTDGEMSRIYNESQGDINKMLELGKQSPMARWVVPQLQAQQMARQKAILDNQKTQSEIYKNTGSGNKDFADAGNTTQKTANSRLTDAKQAIFAGAQNGNPQFIRMGLDAAKAAGAIDEQTHAQFTQQLDSLGQDPAKISEWAKNAILAGSQNPASFLFQTADNAANNAQSDINNQRTTNASIYSTDTNAKTQQQKIAQDQQQFNTQMKFKQQQQYFEQNKPTAYGVDAQGRKYAVVNGKGIYIKDQNGNYITEQPKGGNPKLSDNALKQVGEANTQLAQAKLNYNKIGGLVNDLNSGKMQITPSSIYGAKARGIVGMTNANDLKVNQFQTALNQAANDVLMIAKGTQTEGDAKRAVETIMANPPRDSDSALMVLNNLATIQKNTINTLNSNIDNIYNNYHIPRPGTQTEKSKSASGKPNARTFFD